MSRNDKVNAVSQLKWFGLLQSWLHHHYQSALISLQKMLATPVQSIMTWCVIAIALALPVALLIVVNNVKSLGMEWDGNPRLTVYLHSGLSENTIEQTGKKLEKIEGVFSVEYVSPQQGLQQLQQSGQFGDAISTLTENPLPPVYLLRSSQIGDVGLQTLEAKVQALAEVESTQIDLLWVKRLGYMVNLVERSVWLLGCFLCLGVFITIANTIGLAIENRREEIIVIKLVGGTNSFVRRPLLYSGFWYGLTGGIIACLLLLLAGLVLSPIVSGLLTSYDAGFPISGFGFKTAAYLMIGGAVLGFFGAWLAVAKNLKQIEPN